MKRHVRSVARAFPSLADARPLRCHSTSTRITRTMCLRVARACSALARWRLFTQSSLHVDVVRRGSFATGTFFTLENDGGTFFASWPASPVFAKRYILNPTVHGLDPGHNTCLCRDVLEAAHTRCQAMSEASKYSTYGCVLVSDVMHATSAKHMKFGQTHWIDEEARVMDAVRQMFATHLSALVVMQREALDADRSGVISDEELLLSAENDAIVGIITERDYLNAVAQGQIGLHTKVKDIMTDFKHSDAAGESKKKLIFASPDSTALAAVETMTNNRLRHVPVIGSKGFDKLGNPIQPRVLGVISIGELLKSVLAEARCEIHQLEGYIHGDAEYSAEEHVSGHSNDVKVETREQRDEASSAK
jgi:CBS domain-containing protein